MVRIPRCENLDRQRKGGENNEQLAGRTSPDQSIRQKNNTIKSPAIGLAVHGAMAADITRGVTSMLPFILVALLFAGRSHAFAFWRRKHSSPRRCRGEAASRAAPTRSPPALSGNQQSSTEDETTLMEFDVSTLLDIGSSVDYDSDRKKMNLLSAVISASFDNAGGSKGDEAKRWQPTETFQQDDDGPLALPEHLSSMRPFLCISNDTEVRKN